MTVNETKLIIENELKAAKESFGEASSLVEYSLDVEVNTIEGASDDITCVLGSLSIGPEGSTDDDRLFLPLDAELDDDDNVNSERLYKSIEIFKAKVKEIRDRILASNDYSAEAKAVIEDFDRELDEKYRAEIDKLNKVAKRNLIYAAIAAAAAAVTAILVLVLDKIS